MSVVIILLIVDFSRRRSKPANELITCAFRRVRRHRSRQGHSVGDVCDFGHASKRVHSFYGRLNGFFAAFFRHLAIVTLELTVQESETVLLGRPPAP